MTDLAAAQLLPMIKGYWVSQIVGTLAQLEIADYLAHGPLDCDVLAHGIGCEPKATYRLLRASADVGLVSVLPDGRFGLTPLGELLRSNEPGSMRSLAVALTAPGHWLPWGRLAEAVRLGERQTVAALGHELFDYYAINPSEGSAFTGAMANHSNAIAKEIALVLDTSTVTHVVDIGGLPAPSLGRSLMRTRRCSGQYWRARTWCSEPRPRSPSVGSLRAAASPKATSSRTCLKPTFTFSNPLFMTGMTSKASKSFATALAPSDRRDALFSSNGSCRSTGNRARRRSPT
jgi:hypothetical protein